MLIKLVFLAIPSVLASIIGPVTYNGSGCPNDATEVDTYDGAVTIHLAEYQVSGKDSKSCSITIPVDLGDGCLNQSQVINSFQSTNPFSIAADLDFKIYVEDRPVVLMPHSFFLHSENDLAITIGRDCNICGNVTRFRFETTLKQDISSEYSLNLVEQRFSFNRVLKPQAPVQDAAASHDPTNGVLASVFLLLCAMDVVER